MGEEEILGSPSQSPRAAIAVILPKLQDMRKATPAGHPVDRLASCQQGRHRLGLSKPAIESTQSDNIDKRRSSILKPLHGRKVETQLDVEAIN